GDMVGQALQNRVGIVLDQRGYDSHPALALEIVDRFLVAPVGENAQVERPALAALTNDLPGVLVVDLSRLTQDRDPKARSPQSHRGLGEAIDGCEEEEDSLAHLLPTEEHDLLDESHPLRVSNRSLGFGHDKGLNVNGVRQVPAVFSDPVSHVVTGAPDHVTQLRRSW